MNKPITTHSGEIRNLNVRSFSLSLVFHGILIVLIALIVTQTSPRNQSPTILSASISFSLPKVETIPLHKADVIGAVKPAVKKQAWKDTAVHPKRKRNRPAKNLGTGDSASPSLALSGPPLGDMESVAANYSSDNRSTPLLLNAQDIKIPYPEQARARRVEGIVRMKLTVAESGKVIEADIISGPAYGLRQAALMVARKLFFLPATDELGRARVAQIEHEVIFRLTQSS